MNDNPAADVGDVTAGVTIIAALNEALPPVAAGLGIIWTLIRIYDYFDQKFKDKDNEDDT